MASEEEREIRKELAFHLERLTEEFQAQGMSRRMARRAALRRFGRQVRSSRRSWTRWNLGIFPTEAGSE